MATAAAGRFFHLTLGPLEIAMASETLVVS
jgi:hypothetical protein